jgi:microcystin degradation protein MlrC
MRIGGKYEPHSGPCLDIEAEVLSLERNAYQPQQSGGRNPMGDIAVIRVEGIEVMLTATRTNVFMPDAFEMHGITIADKQVLAIKNLYKQTDVFAPLVRKQLYVATPGTSNADWSALPFKRLPRPMWPFDADPLGRDGGKA